MASRFEGRTQHANVDHDDNVSPSATENPDSFSTGSGDAKKKRNSHQKLRLQSTLMQDQDASSVSQHWLGLVRCRCKEKCKTNRKPGKDCGCECKTEGAACNENCKCNRKTCKNKIGLDQWFVVFSNYSSICLSEKTRKSILSFKTLFLH